MESAHLDENDDDVHVMSVFKNGRSDAVRIPKEMGLKADQVLMKREGHRIIVEEKQQADRVAKLRALLVEMRQRGNIEEEFNIPEDGPPEPVNL